jgi:type II secretory pathway component PulK
MKSPPANLRSGVALIMVLVCITVLGTMAALFAYAMKVETRLAINANSEDLFDLAAASAVDYCKAVLAASLNCPEEPFDASTQVWAGGGTSTCSNSLLALVKPDLDLGYAKCAWKMVDLERKANINIADQPMLEGAMRLVGLDGADSDAIVGAILDWIDRDKNPNLNGVESDYYEGLEPPYKCKDGFMDDLSELLLVRGVTPEMYGVEGLRPPPPPPSLREQLQLGFEETPVQRPCSRICSRRSPPARSTSIPPRPRCCS